MSETPVYFLLAQLFTLMTASLRLALAFLVLALLTLLGSVFFARQAFLLRLSRYWLGWVAGLALAGGSFALAEVQLLNYANPFVWQGFYLSCVLLGLGGLFFTLDRFLPAKAVYFQSGLILMVLVWVSFHPGFSRSNQVWLTVVFTLPVALALSYFCLWLPLKVEVERSLRHLFHGLWGGSSLLALGLYVFWLYPRVSGLPPTGEFFPFLNLYDWFFVVFMILYSGNLYIDYWLREGKRPLLLAWNYGVVVAALLCLWFNASIFDTLAL
ncbi:hypothetical protein COW36_02160 [bacterium (Candidatus Blackallbacteria) CG17_big_fil_post_rev_8_21_14_2_50_48_46]|uniref:Uncharacterized protein n=1 Tax=bacterium (Candidatus Blackallbacteria) CG17_big_fil_post_rev_8_21_14_2_50_48_46 TaxID=2014261 RepID=A0A2M7G9W3_9BACT|nr:MAG: hypothetical protein COW64_13305 [bacterium (Candidatus Blackallbacteria) CG18_big_fil_WC_8_21_14_2_50_49_26]PIW18938.1 MAG: hypothetical protein COW36_02160 [bacterium (Candidatus Blackallbacteria) CG17_big_fil_post_rev_8_21_14_2_50_48_46]PIW44695.1 MAG: hypothetical protein COW20_23950 [bacterium (Candidatus Blackallbacteria) CG13_big_fil_rev_8_21_14_2_50_49_14]